MAQKKRSIFEEVAEKPVKSPAKAGGMIDQASKGSRNAIRLWLIALFVMVAGMVLLGGLTRLSDAGLSITEWRPVTGAIPPLDAMAWGVEFDKYRLTSQFQLANPLMTLEEFKVIYWWEWAHRQLGRLVGLIWALGFIWFMARKSIPTGWTGRLLLVGGLGGLQGAIGWWMVRSGLGGEATSVASYRLAVHLGLAFVILGLLGWYAMLLGRSEAALMSARRAGERKLFKLSTGLLHFSMLQILLGALVAGIDAGRNYPTWPLMNGSFFPSDVFYLNGEALPIWRAFFESPGLVQFMHRSAGYLLVVFGLIVWLRGRKSAHAKTRQAFHLVFAMLLAQVGLGIAAVLTAAHLHVAITHQIGAVLLWVLILRARMLSKYPVSGSIRKGTV